MDKNCNDSIEKVLMGFSAYTLVEKPCKVVNVNSQYSVDIEYYDNGEKDMLYNVPVKHLQTKNAYIFLGLKPGDCGTVRFFDNDTEDYYEGKTSKNPEIRKHDINDSVFSVGFYPRSEQYVFNDGDLVIATNSGALINLTGGEIKITGTNITVTGSNVELGENTKIDGRIFLEHTHSNGNNGSPTGKVI